MKEKRTRHKETNTFKFKRFAERIDEINVDVFHRIRHRNEDSDDEEVLVTIFHRTLQKWNMLNLTEGYTKFRREVQHVVTLPQLVYHKHQVIDSLKNHLKINDIAYLQPILEMVVAAARDLQRDFYEFIPDFLGIIINLLNTQDPEVLEFTFTNLAYLFKFMWLYFVRNIDTIFEILLPLLADKRVYINNFAAESFAFVARKITGKDQNSFLTLLFNALKKNPAGVQGCGKLLFEVVSGVPGKFHSCAEKMFNLYLQVLEDENIDSDIAFNVLSEVFEGVNNSINVNHSKVFWDVIFKTLDQNLVKENEKILIPLGKLLLIVLNYRDGKMLLEPTSLIPLIVKGISIYENKDNLVLLGFIELAVSILLADNIKLSQETSYELTSKLLSIRKKEILITIIEKLVNHSSFETQVLTMALQRSVLRTKFTDRDLNLFIKIVSLRAPPKLNGINLDKWRSINLDLRTFPNDTVTLLVDMLKQWEDGDSISENSLKVITILPHIKIPMRQELVTALKQVFVAIFQKLIQDESVEIEKRSSGFLLTLESVVHMLNEEEVDKLLEESGINFEDLIPKYWNNINILNAVDLFYTYILSTKFKTKYINAQSFKFLHTHLAKKLASPYRNARLIVCHLYSLFKDVEELFINKSNDSKSVLELMFMAESTEISVQSYRDRLSYLQALSLKSNTILELDPTYYHAPLYFLLGNFFVNFSLLWEPVSQTIATYATGEFKEFWSTFLGELKENCQMSIPSESFSCEILNNLLKSLMLTDKPDYDNYKTLLWTCMNKFPEYSEARNRDLTVLFIQFVESNYFISDSSTGKRFSIEKKGKDKKEEELDDDFDDEEDEEETTKDLEEKDDAKIEKEVEENENENRPRKRMKVVKSGKTSNFKLLLAQLKLFSMMHNPRSLYREREMYEIYMELLKSKNMELQKAVLDCLFTYKLKELIPYKENLYGLIDEKNLRNELARFKILDDEVSTETIKPEDRKVIMPILMRLIYAKMVTRGTGRAAGAAGGLARRKIIIRFLMGVKEEEMMLFAEMACKPFEKYPISFTADNQPLNLKKVTTEITSTINLSNIIPPKRLRSAINLLSTIIEEFGMKMSKNLLPRLLAILLCALAEITGILNNSESVLSGFLSIIKELKNTCIGILGRFFDHFEIYEWSQPELDALFDVAVFPWLEKLPTEGIYSPTVLLKLFNTWCNNPRYHCLLIKHQDDNKNVTCLPFIMKLLLGEKTNHSVVNMILEMIQNLLTLKNYEKKETDEADELPFVPLDPTNILQVDTKTALPDKSINYGSKILLPYVPDILEFFKRRLQKSKMNVKRIEASILSRISELTLDPETSNTLTHLLIPISVKRASRGESDQVIEELLITITNLLKNVEKPQEHLRSILPLLLYVSSVSLRRNLLEIFKTIATGSTDTETVSKEIIMRNLDLLVSLNAMSTRWIEQPDCERRHETFEQINSIINSEDGEESKTLTLEFGIAVLYCCFHFLKNESDLSLRSESRDCIKKLGVKLINLYKSNNADRLYLIEDTILNLIKEGIKSKNDHIKLQSISLLGALSKECSDAHPVFRDLHLLTNEKDPEVDFFDNLEHPQVGRRARALLKFCTVAKTLTKSPNIKTLTLFIFPLASSFLCDEIYISKNNIVDAAIEAVGTICRLLPWHQYSVILKYYLDKINKVNEYQKQVIRIIISILDAFHFDLSKLKTDKNVIENQTIDSTKTEDADEEKPEESNEEERLDEELAKLEEKVPEEKKESAEPIMNKLTVLSQSAANKLVFDITHTILPQLNRSILSRTQHELSHKVNRKRTGYEKEEEELMRVPIALALVKLLQKLPGSILNKNLSGIFMKLCTFLKSRLESVRRSTREVLEKIMITLGPDYLHYLLKEMNSLLTKGFQIHVLAYTIHAVLRTLKSSFQPNHINDNLQSILQVCKIDLFGLTSEEKEVKGILKNVSEAKSTKSISIFRILGECISESCLLDLVQPFHEILSNTRSHKVLMKVVESLSNIAVGLADNIFIKEDRIVIFLYGIVSKSIPSLNSKPDNKKADKFKPQLEKSDCYIIPAAPKSRMGIKAASKTSADAHEHVMIEFGMKLLHILLKREKLSGSEFKVLLDPFVPIVADNMKSQHIKMSTLSLQCANKILKMDLESIPQHIEGICETVFSILHKYGSAGLAKGDNFELVTAAFKTMTTFVRDMKSFNMTIDQIKVLILYIEQDLYNNERQATAFSLVKAIIERKIKASEIHKVIEKVAVLSVTSESIDVQKQCREVFYKFLMEYPLGKKLEKHLSFYLAQLSYELKPGRMSALEMIHNIINGFPEDILVKQSALIFLMVGARLVNDDDPTCCKFAAKCVKELITRVNHNQCLKLFEIVIQWLKDTNLLHRRLAVQLCGIFVSVKKDGFEAQLEELLPLIFKQFYSSDSENLEEGKFVLKKTRRNNQVTIKDFDRVKDHLIFQTLQLTLKISSYCQVFLKSEKYVDKVQALAEYSQSFLAYPHLWVRLAATQQIGFILAAIDQEKLIEIIKESEIGVENREVKDEDDEDEDEDDSEDDEEDNDEGKELKKIDNGVKGYIYCNPIKTLRSLSLDLIAQLHPEMDVEEFSDQVIKNLVFIARVIKSVPSNNDTDKSDTANISIFWLLKRLKKSVNYEITQFSKSTRVRTAVFKWIAGVVTTIDIDPFLKPILFQLMSPLVREMLSMEESNKALRKLSYEVGKLIKKRVGDERYNSLLEKVQQKINIRKAERKKNQKQQFIINPELAARRKIAKQQKKKEATKRKNSQIRGKKVYSKKQKLQDDDDL